MEVSATIVGTVPRMTPQDERPVVLSKGGLFDHDVVDEHADLQMAADQLRECRKLTDIQESHVLGLRRIQRQALHLGADDDLEQLETLGIELDGIVFS